MNLLNLSNMEIKSMSNKELHQAFLAARSEINKLNREKQRSIDLEIVLYSIPELSLLS